MPHGLALRARANQHFAYSGRSVLVADLAGRVTGQGSEGFYVENTRLLSRHELTVDGRPLEPVAASPVEGSALLAYAQVPEGPTVPRGAVAIEMSCFVGEGLREVLRLENYSARDGSVRLEHPPGRRFCRHRGGPAGPSPADGGRRDLLGRGAAGAAVPLHPPPPRLGRRHPHRAGASARAPR